MIIKAKLIDTDKIWKLLDLANDSSLSHYTKEEIKIFKIENTKNLIKKYIVDHNYISLVYLNKTRNITGYCVYNTHQHILYRLYVSPETQGKGIGTKLINHIKQLSKKLGSDKIIVPSRKNAIIFYEKNGFIKTGNYQDWITRGGVFQQDLLKWEL